PFEGEAPDHYDYDPERPVPSVGGQWMMLEDSGPWDRRSVQRRDDVLVYDTGPLADDLEVVGPVTLTLFVSSSAPDTDFTGTLSDVHPDGKAIMLTEGIMRARFRDSFEEPELMEPRQVYEIEVDMWETGNLFKAGHSLRLEVSSSNFPRFERNQNTGTQPGLDADIAVASQTIYHDAAHASYLTLPVMGG
ncbi:MAG: CocE/NonD family hydrolase, partial [SAR202 cluster bacterium]|nr:CocE/NonD family hydrolase [SAR202 cluster bacterium]